MAGVCCLFKPGGPRAIVPGTNGFSYLGDRRGRVPGRIVYCCEPLIIAGRREFVSKVFSAGGNPYRPFGETFTACPALWGR